MDELDQKPDAFYKALVAARAERMTTKAATKYGPTATSPKGDESRDIFDYTINELAGIPRYSEMMLNRLADMDLTHNQHHRMQCLIQWMQKDCANWAWILERMRQELIFFKEELGASEKI